MNTAISKMKYALLGLFAVASLTAVGYEWWFVWPAEKCEEKQAWWDPKDHQCLTPLPIWNWTKRKPGSIPPAKP